MTFRNTENRCDNDFSVIQNVIINYLKYFFVSNYSFQLYFVGLEKVPDPDPTL